MLSVVGKLVVLVDSRSKIGERAGMLLAVPIKSIC